MREKKERWEKGERRDGIRKEKWKNEREKQGREWEKEAVVQDYRNKALSIDCKCACAM